MLVKTMHKKREGVLKCSKLEKKKRESRLDCIVVLRKDGKFEVTYFYESTKAYESTKEVGYNMHSYA